MISLKNASQTALKDCMALKKDEKILIIYDFKKAVIASSLYKQSKKITNNVKIIRIKAPKRHGEEPIKDVAEQMKEYDVVLLVTSRSLSHTNARINATKAGARIASMPGITIPMFLRGMNVDYKKIEKTKEKIIKILKKGKNVHITTDLGTDITMSVKGRKPSEGVLPNKKGLFHNLPSGEADLSPVEGSAEGVFIVDASMLEKVDKPITITVEKGFAVSIVGRKTADKVKKSLESVYDKRAYNVAELGIGVNYGAKISGNVLEDEKVLGTCHIALGNNKSYGGNCDVPIHIDGIMRNPTIIIDNKKIMQKGNLLI